MECAVGISPSVVTATWRELDDSLLHSIAVYVIGQAATAMTSGQDVVYARGLVMLDQIGGTFSIGCSESDLER